MTGRGEQGEHYAGIAVLSPRVVEMDWRSPLLLTLLTPAHHGFGGAGRIGHLA